MTCAMPLMRAGSGPREPMVVEEGEWVVGRRTDIPDKMGRRELRTWACV